jgi:hypothetical protein
MSVAKRVYFEFLYTVWIGFCFITAFPPSDDAFRFLRLLFLMMLVRVSAWVLQVLIDSKARRPTSDG